MFKNALRLESVEIAGNIHSIILPRMAIKQASGKCVY